MSKESSWQSVISYFSKFYQKGIITPGIPLIKGSPGIWKIIQLQFREIYCKDAWLKREASESITKIEGKCERMHGSEGFTSVWVRELHLRKWGELYLCLGSVVSGVRVPGVRFGPAGFPFSFLSSSLSSTTSFFYFLPHIYEKRKLILMELF